LVLSGIQIRIRRVWIRESVNLFSDGNVNSTSVFGTNRKMSTDSFQSYVPEV